MTKLRVLKILIGFLIALPTAILGYAIARILTQPYGAQAAIVSFVKQSLLLLLPIFFVLIFLQIKRRSWLSYKSVFFFSAFYGAMYALTWPIIYALRNSSWFPITLDPFMAWLNWMMSVLITSIVFDIWFSKASRNSVRAIVEDVDLKFRLTMPEYFFDEPYGAKGYFFGCQLEYEGQTYNLSFYDSARLAQTIKDDIENNNFFFERNLIVVPEITTANFEKAVQALVNTNQVRKLSPN